MAEPQIRIKDSKGNEAFSVNGEDGFVAVGGKKTNVPKKLNTLVVRDTAQKHRLALNGNEGRVSVRDAEAKETVALIGPEAFVAVGGESHDGTVLVRGGDGVPLVELGARAATAVIGVGNAGRPGVISVFDGTPAESIQINGATGDIVLQNADCAEEFEVVGEAAPGSVMVLNDAGGLELSRRPYDTRVAGVVSGAGSLRPGIVLGRTPDGGNRVAVALVGKVYCRVDATREPIRPGDLLTSAATAGCAMRASDRRRAPGAVIGKAMASLAGEVGMIPVLVALQ
jgi:hypothetical protein